MAEIRVEQKRRSLGWLWLLLALVVIAAVAWWFWSQNGGRVDTGTGTGTGAVLDAVRPALAFASELLHRAPRAWVA